MEPLQVQQVSFYPKENAERCRTSDYELVSNEEMPTAVLRRGENFYFCIQFQREFQEDYDIVNIAFGFSSKPNASKGTLIYLAVRPERTEFPEDTDKWALRYVRKTENNDILVEAHIAPFAHVGIWGCTVYTEIKGDTSEKQTFKCDYDIYILFNPWCPEDSVYLDNDEERNEYVMNESGKIWCGSFKKPIGRRWNFGQFDEEVLPAAVFLLEMSRLPHINRGSPVLVTRAISAMINSMDDDGVVEGCWDGVYENGVSPQSWTGSTLIMDQYLQSGGKPVRYGQCWVFSAVVVSICRALGIPCRSTTNYISAHDTDGSLTVDKYFDEMGNKLDTETNDSCWNFHVWNDVWMARPDLPAGYGGWQIIDATPQETSNTRYQCGPTSVVAVRRGEVFYQYDTPFVFAEVNADICHLQKSSDSEWGYIKLSINKYQVGKCIVTKRVDADDDQGDTDMWDVTSLFKNPEGSEAERLAFYKAISGNVYTPPIYDIVPAAKDVEFDLIDIDTVPLGAGFSVVVNIVNHSSEERNIHAVLTAETVFYNGVKKATIKREPGNFRVMPGDNEQLVTRITPSDYIDMLDEHGLVKIYAIANVMETKQTWSEEDDFTLYKPQINITFSEAPTVGVPFEATFRLQNPLPMPLTECSYTLEGPGIHKQKTVGYPDVPPHGEVEFFEQFTVKRPGNKRVIATFNSRNVSGIVGSTKVDIVG